jgi:MFS family permease
MTIKRLAAPHVRVRTAPHRGATGDIRPRRATGQGRRPRIGELIRASGGGRYAVAVAVDALGSGMLRPFLLLYGVRVLGLSVPEAGVAMSLGMSLGLITLPGAGRWLDRGARSAVVAASMLIRVLGVIILLAAGGLSPSPLWGFAAAALFIGIGNQLFPPAHAALVAALAPEKLRDAALAAARSLRNAGFGAGALIAMVGMSGGPAATRSLAATTGLGYTLAAVLAWSVRVRAGQAGAAAPPARARSAVSLSRSIQGIRGLPRVQVTALDLANLPYAFCFNVLEVALPAVLVVQLHASPAWSAAVFAGNTGIVGVAQIAAVLWMARYSRRSMMAASGLVLALSYLGFWLAAVIGHGNGAAAGIAAVSVLYTAGEIMYTGSATALIAATTPPHLLGRALARFQLTSGIGLAASPAVLMVLLARGEGAMWGTLILATGLAALAVARFSGSAEHRRATLIRATPSGAPASDRQRAPQNPHDSIMPRQRYGARPCGRQQREQAL